MLYICRMNQSSKEQDNTELLAVLYSQEEKLLKQLRTVQNTIIEHGGRIRSAFPAIKGERHLKYDSEMPWGDKILVALTNIGSGFVADIVNELARLDSTVDKKKIKHAITQRASQLFREGIIDKEEFGLRYKYKMK